ncbi:MAG: AMP-binding protein, partial [Planctomycetota bacterium]
MSETIENLFQEGRSFPPPKNLALHANAQPEIYATAAQDPQAFWVSEAQKLRWKSSWEQVLDDSEAPFYRWFVGGKLNVTESCLDRHVETTPDRIAFHWEGEPGDAKSLTYAELLSEVCRASNALKELGVGKGDVVAIYMGMVPEIIVAMLACARIGAAHSVVFGG